MSNPVSLLKGLADETRLKILMLIELNDDLCVCELSAALEEVQPKISRHLARLRKDGLVLDRRQGQWVFYQLGSVPDWVRQTLGAARMDHPEFLAASLARLDAMGEMGERPERLKVLCSG